jgi:ribosome maturation factor RimP
MAETHLIEAMIADRLAPALVAQGYDLVRVKLMAGGLYRTLQVMAERRDGRPMTVQDCVAVSQMAGKRLRTEGLLAENCTLEVSAPGADRPLVRSEDFERFTGCMALVETQVPAAGRQRFQGRIVRVNGRDPDAEVELYTATGAVRVPVRRIIGARLAETGAVPSEDDTALT